jgi:hypothetical protein
MNVLDKDENIKLSGLAGHLHEVCIQATNKELHKLLLEKHSIDESYFRVEITLKLYELSRDEFQPLRTVTVYNTDNL